MHVGRHIALAHADFKLHFQSDVLGQGGDVLIRIQHDDVLIALNLSRSHRTLGIGAEDKPLRLVRIHGKTHLLDVQDNIRHVFKYAVNGSELMLHAGDFHRHKGRPLQGGQKHATKGVADRGAITPLQRLAHELAVRAAGRFFLAGDLIGLHQLGPVPRVDKAFALFDKHGHPAYLE